MSVNRDTYVGAMRQFPAAVSLITTGTGPDRAGLTATAVMSLTAEPPQVGVAVNKTASAYAAIRRNAVFCVNTLAAHHADLAARFSGAIKGAERFAVGPWSTLATGSPALEDALVCLDCAIASEVDLGTHTLLVGRVEAISTRPALKPLLFVDGDWAGLMAGTRKDVDAFRHGLQRSLEAIDQAIEATPDPAQQLQQFVRNFTMVYIGEQEMAQKYLGAHLYVPPDSMADLHRASRLFDDRLTQLLEDGRDRGEFDVGNARITAFAISGLVAWVHRWFRPGGQFTAEEIAEQLATIAQRMVEPRPDPR